MRMKCLSVLAVFFWCTVGAQAKEYNILDFGAKADSSVVSTFAIQKAIDTCHENGGGRVLIPSGVFLTGTIILKDNVELCLENGAVLYGSRNIADYPDLKPKYVSLRTQGITKQLIYAENAQNIAISGTGEINGQGKAFVKSSSSDEGVARPHLIQMIACRNVHVRDVSLRNSGAWMQHYLACEQMQIRGLRIFNHNNYNNDGIDIDGCKNVTVSDLISDSDDDGITLKSTSAKPCENISITNCIVSSHCNAIKMGTESNGGFRDITISNCVVKPSQVADSKFYGKETGISGISLEIVDGGTMEGVSISDIKIEGTYSPIFIRLGNRARPFKKEMEITNVGILKDILISNVIISDAKNVGCSITGLPGHLVEHIVLNNIVFRHEGGGTAEDAYREISEKEKSYPEATMFGILPASGFYIRHAGHITLSGVQVSTSNRDSRPAFYFDDLSDSEFSDLQLLNNDTIVAGIFMKQCNNIVVKGCTFNGVSSPFVRAEGKEIHGINIINNYLKQTSEIISVKGAAKGSIGEQGNVLGQTKPR